jgi:hypothetical protein
MRLDLVRASLNAAYLEAFLGAFLDALSDVAEEYARLMKAHGELAHASMVLAVKLIDAGRVSDARAALINGTAPAPRLDEAALNALLAGPASR